MIFPLCTVWLSCKDVGGVGYAFMLTLWNAVYFRGLVFSSFWLFIFLFFNQAIIIVCVLSMKKQPCISREPWNWILGILGPGHWWDMSTWKWRTHLLLFRLIGELLVVGLGGTGGRDTRSLCWACRLLTWILPFYRSIFHFLDMPLRLINGTTEPGTALGRPMKS